MVRLQKVTGQSTCSVTEAMATQEKGHLFLTSCDNLSLASHDTTTLKTLEVGKDGDGKGSIGYSFTSNTLVVGQGDGKGSICNTFVNLFR